MRWLALLLSLSVLTTGGIVIEVARYAVERGRHQGTRCVVMCQDAGSATGSVSDTGCTCDGSVDALCDESAQESRAQLLGVDGG